LRNPWFDTGPYFVKLLDQCITRGIEVCLNPDDLGIPKRGTGLTVPYINAI